MNFAYGVIAAVGVLVAISFGFIASAPDDIIQPRIASEEMPTVCTMEYAPVCGVDGETFGNLCTMNASDVKLAYDGECVSEAEKAEAEKAEAEKAEAEKAEAEKAEAEKAEAEKAEAEKAEAEKAEAEKAEAEKAEAEKAEDTSMVTVISIPHGSGVAGCETDDECFLPYEITVPVGTTVMWSNDDTAAHTVTSGIFADGFDGIFDSRMFTSGSTYEFTFNDPGTYDYFCLVHPWMVGIINIGESEAAESEAAESEAAESEAAESEAAESEAASKVTTTEMALTISIPNGAGISDCETNDECFLPYEITVPVGAIVTWSNDDIAAHTVTSGNVDAGSTGVFDSRLFTSGSTYEFTFNDPGTYDYFCNVHPSMIGIIHVG